MAKEHFKFVCAVYLFLKRNDKILLLRRYNTGFEDGNYGLISGHINGGESIFNAMSREAKEEAGIDISPTDLELVHVMHRKCDSPEYERVCFFFLAEKWDGDIKNMEPEKCDNMEWFSIQDLPKNTISYIRRALDNFHNNVFFSEDGWT